MANDNVSKRALCRIFARREEGNGIHLARMGREMQKWINDEVVSKGGRITNMVSCSHDTHGLPLVVITVIAEVPGPS